MLNKLKFDLKKIANREKAEFFPRFFKAGKGEYAEGDKFIGVTVPNQRLIARKYSGLAFSDIQKLLNSKIHEHRLTALIILVEQFRKGGETERKKIFSFYIKNRSRVNNWDLVDASAGYIVGGYLLNRQKEMLTKLASSQSLWDRRIAIVATHRFIYEGRLEETFRISQMLLNDKHDLIHKSVGWMLREAGKKNKVALENFLKKYKSRIPRTTLRYAIEKFPSNIREAYLKK